MYSNQEFFDSFQSFDKENNGIVNLSEINDLLRVTYGFEPLEIEVDSTLTSK